jgi:hypothetical protein
MDSDNGCHFGLPIRRFIGSDDIIFGNEKIIKKAIISEKDLIIL